MKCCNCHHELAPTELEQGLPAYECVSCGGALLSLAPYMAWAKRANPVAESDAPPFEPCEAHDTKRAMACPKCSRLMLRFAVLADRAHGLDFCFHCEEVWLDRGEWAYLQRLGLHTRLRAVSTDAYQRRLRDQALLDAQRQRFAQAVGDEAFAQAEQFRNWLQAQPAREAILRYVSLKA